MQSRTNDEIQKTDSEKVGLYRSLLNIVAQLRERQYTEGSSTEDGQQADERQLDDLSDPASDNSTQQG